MKLVATVASSKEIEMAERADIIELRLDLFELEELKKEKEVILTCRRVADGGKFSGEDEIRLEKLRYYQEKLGAEYVDIESDLPDSAFEFNCSIIESYHNFAETPEYSYLSKLVESRRGDVVKIATMGKSKRDVETMVRILVNHENVVAFLMGEKFSFTRILAALLGSPFVYCYVGSPKAPGQISLDEAAELLRRLVR